MRSQRRENTRKKKKEDETSTTTLEESKHGVPCVHTFQRVKVPNLPDSGKDIAEHQGCPS